MIKHISFDLWQTLIRPNPAFRIKRAEIIAARYNIKDRTITEIVQFIVEQDKLIDKQNETNDTKMPAIEMYEFVLRQMNVSSSQSIPEEVGFLLNASNELFLEFPPNIENYLNHKLIKSLDDINSIIKNEQFRFNTRVVKYILNATDEQFDKFIEEQDCFFVNDLYYNAIGNEYFKFPVYLRNLNKLKQLIN